MKPSSPQSRFQPVAEHSRIRTIGVSAGEHGCGKSDFWLQGPSPVYVLSFDNGLEGVVEHVRERYPDKDIRVVQYDWLKRSTRLSGATEEADRMDLAQEVLGQFNEDYEHALQQARTVLVDKETDLWGIRIWAKLGSGQQSRYYGPLYDEAHAMVDLAIESDCTVGYIQSLKDEYQADKPTGRRTPRGCNRLGEWCFLAMEHVRREGKFIINIDKCRQNTSLADESYTSLSKERLGLTFQELGQMLLEGTSAEEWS